MMMPSIMCRSLTLFIICMALHEGCGLPLSDKAETPAQSAHPHHIRTKRCSCNSWDDKECVYFCHLDIIWVNTPSKLLPYGLGSPLSRRRRRRRSADRCECLNPADRTCSSFCRESSDEQRTDSLVRHSATKKSNKLLESLRGVVKSNLTVAKKTSNKRKLRSKTRR